MIANAQTGSLHSLLFEEGRQLENFKFFPGTRVDVTAAELCQAADVAVRSAIVGGLTDTAPQTGREKSSI